MLARRKAKLPFYLNALREKEYAEKYPGCLLNNFHNLLRFWQRHYLNKDKDSTCLENVSSSVEMKAFTVQELPVASNKQHEVCPLCLLLMFSHLNVIHSKHSDREITSMHAVKTASETTLSTLSAASQWHVSWGWRQAQRTG